MTYDELLKAIDEKVEEGQVQALRAVGPVLFRTLAGMGLVVVPAWMLTTIRNTLAKAGDDTVRETESAAKENGEPQ